MSFVDEYGKQILQWYNEEEKSTGEIAKLLHTYPNKIIRVLKKLGAEIRDRSERQRLAIKNGVVKPPMLGKKHSEEAKESISKKNLANWDSLDDDERERRSEAAKKRWEALSDDERDAFLKAGQDAVREASREGSKLEKFMAEVLTKKGFNVIIHKMALVENVNLELDLLIPELSTVIEINGPSHYLPIWGEDRLAQTIKSDNEKTGLLLKGGYCIVLVKNIKSSQSAGYMRQVTKEVITILKKIDKKFPPPGKRIIEVEI